MEGKYSEHVDQAIRMTRIEDRQDVLEKKVDDLRSDMEPVKEFFVQAKLMFQTGERAMRDLKEVGDALKSNISSEIKELRNELKEKDKEQDASIDRIRVDLGSVKTKVYWLTGVFGSFSGVLLLWRYLVNK
jgi:uncharacterized protein YjaZ